jgi:hypothetical protein
LSSHLKHSQRISEAITAAISGIGVLTHFFYALLRNFAHLDVFLRQIRFRTQSKLHFGLRSLDL